MTRSKDDGFLDGMFVKYLAGAVIVACVGMLAWLNRDILFPNPALQEAETVNPEFIKCRDERVAQVTKMRDDGVINDKQFEVFKGRAIETCAGRYTP